MELGLKGRAVLTTGATRGIGADIASGFAEEGARVAICARTKADLDTLLEFYEKGRHESGSFEAGIQFALERMLVDPDFLLRVQRDPPELREPREPRALTDVELASRLSFFLWSSLPDEPLLDLAERGAMGLVRALRAARQRRALLPHAVLPARGHVGHAAHPLPRPALGGAARPAGLRRPARPRHAARRRGHLRQHELDRAARGAADAAERIASRRERPPQAGVNM